MLLTDTQILNVPIEFVTRTTWYLSDIGEESVSSRCGTRTHDPRYIGGS